VSTQYDVVIVGGGIAGSALGTVLARDGVDVLILEKTEAFRDINRGEMMWPWGVRIAQELRLHDLLVIGGAHTVPKVTEWTEGRPDHIDLSDFVDGVDGSLNLAHPRARQVLLDAASEAGASVRRGVTVADIAFGPPSVVRWSEGPTEHSVECGLVVGADGRASTVRNMAGIRLHRYPVSHVAAGMLVRGDDIPMDSNTVAEEDEWLLLSFPQGSGHARVYHCFAAEDRTRYGGPGGVARFLAASAVTAIPGSEAWSTAEPAGPIGTFPCGDAEAHPIGPGVVLIGDAGGYNNYQIGQGLSLALADVEAVSQCVLQSETWNEAAFAPYAEDRSERLGRVRELARLNSIKTAGFRRDPARRDLAAELAREEDYLERVSIGFFTGFAGMDVTATEMHDAVDAFEDRLERALATNAA
jgi:2-polyprenyl-6-methoxyphenol hydroxylase-like FAD-dependent oxidoreductase